MAASPKFAANLTTMFTEFPFRQRIGEAAKAGFAAVEFLFPYLYDHDELAGLLKQHGLTQVLINAPAGDWEGGERGMAIFPDRKQEFRDSVARALDYARALGCGKIHVMSGIVPEGADRAELKRTWLDNMRHAARAAEPFGIMVQVESLNSRNMPGYFLTDQYETLALVREVHRRNVRLQLDIFHAQISNGDLSVMIRTLGPWIGHVQIASVPDRCEPDEGEVFYPHIYRVLEEAGYSSWIGCEYTPRAGTLAGLGWLKTYPQPATASVR